MRIWYVRDGEKTGPVEVTEAWALVRRGEISKKTKVWHEGLSVWQPAEQVVAMRGAFEDGAEAPASSEDEEKAEIVAEPPAFLPGRRLAARWLDLMLYQLVLVALFRITGTKIVPTSPEEVSFGRLMIQFVPLPLMIIEGAFLNGLAATPGKLLLGLRLRRSDGAHLRIGEGVMRSFRVFLLGFGAYLHPILILVGHGVNFFLYRKKGATLWDVRQGYRMEKSNSSLVVWLWFAAALVAVMAATTWLSWPELQPILEEAQRQAQEAASAE